MKPPFQQFLGFVGALLFRPELIDDDDQAQSVLYRRADQTVAGLLSETGFEAIRPEIHVEQGVAVELADLVPGEFALAVIFVIVGIGLDHMAGEFCELGRGPWLAWGGERRPSCRGRS